MLISIFGHVLYFSFPPRSIMRIIYLILCILVLISNIIFKGCIVTRAEQFLTGKKDTILDELLIYLGITVNRETRFAFTIGSIIAISSFLTFTVIADFIWKY